MSVQFGKCNFDGKPVDPRDLDQVRSVLAPHGPDAEGYLCKDNVGILFRAFHTTKESRSEIQPHTSASGTVITWDGRLDNRMELIDELGHGLPVSTDLAIVAAAYKRWGTDSFAKLIGDWALSIWDPADSTLILAKDFIGTRHLYYAVGKDQVTWCTILDPLILFASHGLELEEEYIAGWLSFFPASHLTPYVGIHSTAPASFVRFAKGTQTSTKYWEFDSARRIHYRRDSEYEEHFRFVFANSVRRRLRSQCPALAELSGGMDSSSIVCLADVVAASNPEPGRRVDTVSYYNDSEPSWCDEPYFTIVEKYRSRPGFHIDLGSTAFPVAPVDGFVPSPGKSLRSSQVNSQLSTLLASGGYRVLLSGIGGDEVTGGVPSATPELADLLVSGSVKVLARQLKRWALQDRTPWLHLLVQTCRCFAPTRSIKHAETDSLKYLRSDFVSRNRTALLGYPHRLRFLGPLPSFQENMRTLDGLRRQIGCSAPPFDPLCEKRFPFLDRTLLEFLFAIPREQVIRPGERRSLMRRALANVVPVEILNRKRKGFAYRGILDQIRLNWSDFMAWTQDMACADAGVIEPALFLRTVKEAYANGQVSVVTVLRTLALERWIRSLRSLANAGAQPSQAQQSSAVEVSAS